MELWTVDSYKKNSGVPKMRKRKRLTLTCTSCRQRKIKCDQGRPCSSCTKRKIPADMCIYNDTPFVNENGSDSPGGVAPDDSNENNVKALKDEVEYLKKQLAELQHNRANSNTSTSESTPVNSTNNPKLKLYGYLHSKPNKTVHFGPTSWRSLVDREENFDGLINEAKDYIKNVRKKWKFENDINKMSSEDYKSINVESPIMLLDNLARYLPCYEVVSNHVSRYVKGYWNRRTPILDNDEFLKDFDGLFSQMSDGSCHIRIKNKSIDYAKIALVLIVVKHSMNTENAYSAIRQAYDSTDRMLLYANKLLELSNFMSKPSIPALQTLILVRQFKMINPSDDDGGDGHKGTLQFKTAINMAIVLGLHGDIDSIYRGYPLNLRELLKVIWKHLLFQDAILSFHMGIPLTINRSFINPSGLDDSDAYGKVTSCLRDAVDSLTSNECRQNDLLRIINKMESCHEGDLLHLSTTLRGLSEDTVLSDETCLVKIELKMFAIYAIHVLYDVLYQGTDNSNPDRELFYNGTMKYGVLTISHFIEAMIRFNKICVENANTPEIFVLVEMCQSLVGVSKIIFLKVYTCLYTFELVRLVNINTDAQPTLQQVFSLSITEIERLKVDDRSSMLNISFKSPAFMHALMTLSCKYLLKLRNNSFGTVFSMNFCLLTVLAVFKYFEKFIDQKFHKQKHAINQLTKEKPIVVSYLEGVHDNILAPSELKSSTGNFYPPSANSWSTSQYSLNPSSNTISDSNLSQSSKDFSKSDNNISQYSQANNYTNAPQSATTFTATDDSFNDMVQKILYSGELDFFDVQYGENLSYDGLDDVLAGAGMFYDESTGNFTSSTSHNGPE